MQANLKHVPLVLLALCASSSFAGTGPVHKSLRAYSMGNAFVAVVDDKDAVYYNPAGLNHLNNLGNYEKNPELGYYPSNFIDMRINIGLRAPVSEARAAYSLGRKFQKIFTNAQNASSDQGTDNTGTLMDSLGSHPELADQLNQFDLLPINISTKLDMEMAVPHWGGSIWIDGGVAPYIEGGIITPAAGIDTLYVDAVAQMGVGIGIGDKWSFGLGYKMAKREYLPEVKVSLLEFQGIQDTLLQMADSIQKDAVDITKIGHAFEFGALYQWKRDVRLGVSLRNWFIAPLGNEKITPNLTAGIAYSPRRLQRNTGFSRKVNFAADFENMLNDDKNYKLFSHLNLGMEVEQVLLAVPNWPSLRILKGRVAGGFKGGYPAGGVSLEALRFVEVEFCTWAEEGGYFTGEMENRYWIAQVSIGI